MDLPAIQQKSSSNSRRRKPSWDFGPVSEGIPEYNASSDTHCPIMVAKKLNKAQLRMVKLEKRVHEAQKSYCTRDGVVEKNFQLIAPLPTKTKKKAITYQKEQPVVASTVPTNSAMYEVDLLRKVLTREHQLDELRNLAATYRRIDSKPSKANLAEAEKKWRVMCPLLEKLRLVTVEIVEMVYQWRMSVSKPIVLSWRGENYLLAMLKDYLFLDIPIICKYLKAPVCRNPLLCPNSIAEALTTQQAKEVLQPPVVGDIDSRRLQAALLIFADEEKLEASLKSSEAREDQMEGERVVAKDPVEFLYQSQEQGPVDPKIIRVQLMHQDICQCKLFNSRLERELELLNRRSKEISLGLEESTIPSKVKRLQKQLGIVKKEIRFRSGDLFQRKNELSKKLVVFRTAMNALEATPPQLTVPMEPVPNTTTPPSCECIDACVQTDFVQDVQQEPSEEAKCPAVDEALMTPEPRAKTRENMNTKAVFKFGVKLNRCKKHVFLTLDIDLEANQGYVRHAFDAMTGLSYSTMPFHLVDVFGEDKVPEKPDECALELKEWLKEHLSIDPVNHTVNYC